MRIISGMLKGKSISFLKTKNTRPLKDAVKENIFNIISHSNLINIKLLNSNILDIYSGVGSFGLEAISRGAKKVTFIDKSKDAIKILKKNLSNLDIEDKAVVHENEISKILEIKKLEKYDIFFLDPPFSDNTFLNEISLLKKRKIYKKNSIVIIHREKRSHDDLNKHLSVFLVKIYGRSKILFASFA